MKKGFTLMQLLAITIALLIIFWLILGLILNNSNNKLKIDCYMTSNGLICTYGKLGGE